MMTYHDNLPAGPAALATTMTYQQGCWNLTGGTYYVRGKAVPFWMVYENTGGIYAARSKIWYVMDRIKPWILLDVIYIWILKAVDPCKNLKNNNQPIKVNRMLPTHVLSTTQQME